MHAIWSGSVSFGLVNIPVKLFSGSQSNNLDLDMLRKSDLCPVKYIRVCKKDGKEIPYNEIVKGYENNSNYHYVVLTDEDFENANVEKTHTTAVLPQISSARTISTPVTSKNHIILNPINPEQGHMPFSGRHLKNQNWLELLIMFCVTGGI